MEIKTNKELQQIQRLQFCYLCGRKFKDGENITKDHVPPKAVFLSCDRKNPLILPTHYKCNQKESKTDEIIGQLITALHGTYPKRKNLRLKLDILENSQNRKPVLILRAINLRGVVTRVVKAFHAALYKQYLPNKTRNFFDTPVLQGKEKDGKVTFEKTKIQFPLFVSTIKKNRKAGKLDRIACFNNKCIYECVWEQMDDGTWACIFALNIYDWKHLGDPEHQSRRGCVGFYMPRKGLPTNATKGIMRILEIPINNFEPLDPFGD